MITESFERIYRQNADNIGLFTSTDFALIERMQQGELVDVEKLINGPNVMASELAEELMSFEGLMRRFTRA